MDAVDISCVLASNLDRFNSLGLVNRADDGVFGDVFVALITVVSYMYSNVSLSFWRNSDCFDAPILDVYKRQAHTSAAIV